MFCIGNRSNHTRRQVDLTPVYEPRLRRQAQYTLSSQIEQHGVSFSLPPGSSLMKSEKAVKRIGKSLTCLILVLLCAHSSAVPPVLSAGVTVDASGRRTEPKVNAETHDKNSDEMSVKAMNQFAFDLYAKLREQEGNLFFSPYSISSALAMTYAGARGETEKQMAAILHFPPGRRQVDTSFAALTKRLGGDGKPRQYQLNVANALWKEKSSGFLSDFLETAKSAYGAEVSELDFATDPENSRLTINRWVEKQTQEKIKDLLPPRSTNSLTRLVLTNAIYFKGDWVNQFKKGRTADDVFMVTKEQKVTVPLMRQTADFKYTEGDGFQALELPYAGKELSMVVVLPRQVDGLATLERSFTADKLSAVLTKLRQQKVVVYLPKFKLTERYELSETLSEMGMPLAFSGGADFSGMTGKRDFSISLVFHKAYVDVDEKGTEATAATAVAMGPTGARPQRPEPPVFRADHPFIFLVRDNGSGSILFMGRVMNPIL